MNTEEKIQQLLDSLAKTKFRGSFHLNSKMKNLVKEKGLSTIKEHANDLVIKRLKPSYIKNDGKQTPMKQVHPVFIAQHATGCCCRGCLERIHHIKKGVELTDNQVNYIVYVIMMWIKREMEK